jgi:stalled ribosome rescue protein Dom34
VIASAELNLVRAEPVAIADAVEPLIEDAWTRHTTQLIEQAYERARAGGAATIGAHETLAALAEGRVHHLLLDPDHDFSGAAGTIPPSLRVDPELLAERAVEAAIATSASVSAFAIEQSPTLGVAGGIAALLRY